MNICMIAAIGEELELGKDNKLIWTIPADLKRFKEITMGHTMIMGGKTYRSLPGVLPGRKHIVITRNNETMPFHPLVTYVNSKEEALEACEEEEKVFVIGGAEIYNMFMEDADSLCITGIWDTCKEADTFFPDITPDKWDLANTETDCYGELTYSFLEFKKK